VILLGRFEGVEDEVKLGDSTSHALSIEQGNRALKSTVRVTYQLLAGGTVDIESI
jgi:hypothetical protein